MQLDIGTYKFVKRDTKGRFAVKGLPMTPARKVAGSIVLGIVFIVGTGLIGESVPAYSTLVAGNVYADEMPIELMPKTLENRPHILKRIAEAESFDSHYCNTKLVKAGLCDKYELGQVIVRDNPNGTKDIGRYQINDYHWGKQAHELGLNIYDEADNETMAQWIYDHKGAQPWYLSKQNWNK